MAGNPAGRVNVLVAGWQRLGYEELVFWARPPGMPIEHATASLNLIAKHVLPALQEVSR